MSRPPFVMVLDDADDLPVACVLWICRASNHEHVELFYSLNEALLRVFVLNYLGCARKIKVSGDGLQSR